MYKLRTNIYWAHAINFQSFEGSFILVILHNSLSKLCKLHFSIDKYWLELILAKVSQKPMKKNCMYELGMEEEVSFYSGQYVWPCDKEFPNMNLWISQGILHTSQSKVYDKASEKHRPRRTCCSRRQPGARLS